MTLQEIKYHLSSVDSNVLHILESVGISKDSYGNFIFKEENIEKLKIVLDYLYKVPSLKEDIEELRKTFIYSPIITSITVNKTDWDKVKMILDIIYNKLNTTKEIVDLIMQPDQEDTIRIRLPDYAKDFDDLSKLMNDFKRAISIPINDSNTEGKVEVRSAEPGSIWLIVSLGTVAAVEFIASICWAAAVINKKKKEGDIALLQVKEYDLSIQYKEMLFNAQKEFINKYIQNEVSHIQNNFYTEKDKESSDRLILAITTIGDLFHKGTEIKSGLLAPEKVSNLFPDKKNINGFIESKIKQISEGDSK